MDPYVNDANQPTNQPVPPASPTPVVSKVPFFKTPVFIISAVAAVIVVVVTLGIVFWPKGDSASAPNSSDSPTSSTDTPAERNLSWDEQIAALQELDPPISKDYWDDFNNLEIVLTHDGEEYFVKLHTDLCPKATTLTCWFLDDFNIPVVSRTMMETGTEDADLYISGNWLNETRQPYVLKKSREIDVMIPLADDKTSAIKINDFQLDINGGKDSVLLKLADHIGNPTRVSYSDYDNTWIASWTKAFQTVVGEDYEPVKLSVGGRMPDEYNEKKSIEISFTLK